MANQILAGAVINAGMVIAGVDADNPPVTGSSPAPAPVQTSAKWVVVGATYSSDNGTNSGAAYVYDASDLSATPTKLSHSAAGDLLGSDVSATADKILVSARYDDDRGSNAGAVYVYDANDLSATPTKLTAFDGSTNDAFGMSTVATDDKIVISAVGTDIGAVYVYDANDLSAQPTKLTETNGVSDKFGYQVAASSDKIVVGAPFDDSRTGSVYVYDANNLSATPTKLTAFDGVASDQFGQIVAASSDKIVVGAFFDDDKGTNSGSVYVFDANDLTAQPTKLTAFDGAENDAFGSSIAAVGDKIIVGAYGDNLNVGAVYVYDASDLSAAPTKLVAFDGAENDYAGYAVAASSDKIVVGAFADDDNNQSNSGSVYVYDANDLNATPTKLTAYDATANYYFSMGHKAIAIG